MICGFEGHLVKINESLNLIMSEEIEASSEGQLSENLFCQKVKGSNRLSTISVSTAVSIGGTGFLLASLSSYFGKDFLPLGNPSTLVFIPQGLIMGLYGIAAFLLAVYLWTLISIDFGSGTNLFDKTKGIVRVSRKGFLKEINLEIELKDIQAVKLEVRDGFNARRRITLKVKNRTDIPLSGIGQPKPLVELEKESAQLARFLEVNLEGIS